MATIGGARTLHMEAEIGSLEVGKKADLIVLGLDAPNAVPLYDVYPQVECAEGRGCQDRHYWWAGGAAGSPRAYARPGRDRVARRRIRERGQEITEPRRLPAWCGDLWAGGMKASGDALEGRGLLPWAS